LYKRGDESEISSEKILSGRLLYIEFTEFIVNQNVCFS